MNVITTLAATLIFDSHSSAPNYSNRRRHQSEHIQVTERGIDLQVEVIMPNAELQLENGQNINNVACDSSRTFFKFIREISRTSDNKVIPRVLDFRCSRISPYQFPNMGEPRNVVRKVVLNPIVTGTFLFVLLKDNGKWRTKANELLLITIPFARHVQARITLSSIVSFLKLLFTLGVLSRINSRLTSLALNNFSSRKRGVPWDFNTTRKPEIAIVTGGCSGIGLLTVKQLREKVRVVILDIQAPPIEFENDPSIYYYECDITSADSLRTVATKIRQQVGKPSILINNAGMGGFHTILDTSDQYLEKIFRVNLLSHWATIREFLPSMLESRKGHVITVASLASFSATAGIVDYSSTKAGALALWEGLGQELKHRYKGGDCIQNTIIHPSWAQTPLIADHTKTITGGGMKIMPASWVSDAIVAQIYSGRAAQVFVPRRASIASLLRSWPSWLQEKLRDRMGSKTADKAMDTV